LLLASDNDAGTKMTLMMRTAAIDDRDGAEIARRLVSNEIRGEATSTASARGRMGVRRRRLRLC
jgi:hypothetical protein